MTWDIWESYFVTRYGPNYDGLRQGRSGECAYCSGRITTKASEKMTADLIAAGGWIAEKSRCAHDHIAAANIGKRAVTA